MHAHQTSHRSSRPARSCGTIIIIALALAGPLLAITVAVPDGRVPLTLLLQRQEASLERTPGSFWIHRGLARTHALAAAWRLTGGSHLRGGGRSGQIDARLSCDPCAHVDYRTPESGHVVRGNAPQEDWLEEGEASQDRVDFHRQRAVYHYREALRLANLSNEASERDEPPRRGQGSATGLSIDQTELGLAWNLLQTGSEGDREEAKERLQQIIARQEADRAKGPGPFGDYARDSALMGPLISEAIDYLLPLLGPSEREEHDRLVELHDRLGHRATAETPLAIDLQPQPHGDLVDRAARVEFDLDQTGSRNWTWPRPGVAWLVWNPDLARPIRDGTQLLGNRSFNMAHPDGFAALCMLDSDGDAWLRGAELEGLALWRDGGSGGTGGNDGEPDGRSTVEELASLASEGIVGLRCERDQIRHSGDHLMIRAGVERTVPGSPATPGSSATETLVLWDLVLSRAEGVPESLPDLCPREAVLSALGGQ